MITIAYLVSNQRALIIIVHLKVQTVKLKCADYKIFSKKHDLPFLKLEKIHNFDTHFHPLRNIVLKLFDDKIMQTKYMIVKI